MMCPDENQLARLADGPIPQAELAALEVHLDACTVCSTLITELGALSIGDYPELLPIAPEHYLVGKQLARGGMGKIFTARDRRHGRLVAIKELLASSPASRARFEREARITAKLQHPSIVNFIEAGVWPTGEPFYVMKLIDGESLDKAIARRTTLDARLALLPHVIDVVDALAYAHSIRVIHRDLKPSNVLVGNFGETVVLDWGLAKDLSDTMDSDVVIGPFRPSSPSTEATVAGTVIGTPAYMPPEQARGERVDERADVYALGALLYHVLAGAPPYEGSNATEIVQHVINARPRSLGERSLGVPRELITIVETAMAASPDDRFPTASQLAEDLKKFQTGQLVGAHHYSRWQLLGRWTRRHRVAVAVGAVAAALLVALGVFSLNGIANERERTETQRRVAIANQRDAEELMTFMVGDLSRKLEPLGQLDLLESVATKAVSYFERRPEGSLQDRHRQCLALQSAADVLLAKGDSNGALAASRAMLAIADSLVAEDPGTPRWQADLWFAHDGIGDVLARQGKLAEAMQHHQISLATMSRLAQREPNNLDHPFHLVATRTRIGNVFAAQGEPDKALPEYRIALQLAETLVTREPSNASHQSSLARAHVHVGDVLGTQGDTGQALTHYRASLSIAEQLVRKEPDNTAHRRHLAGSHSSVATMLKLRGDATEALNHYRAAMTIANALADKDPANADWQRDVAVSHTEIGELLAATGDGKGAIREWRAALGTVERIAALDPANTNAKLDVAQTNAKLSELSLAVNNPSAALDYANETKALALELTAKDPTRRPWQAMLSTAHTAVAAALLARHDVTAALDEQHKSLAITKAIAEQHPSDPQAAQALLVDYYQLGNVLVADHQAAQASAAFRSALQLATQRATTDPADMERQRDLSDVQQNLADALMADHQPAAALEQYRASLAIMERMVEVDATNADWMGRVVIAHEKVANTLASLGRVDDARRSYEAALTAGAAQIKLTPDPEWRRVARRITASMHRCCSGVAGTEPTGPSAVTQRL